MDVVRLDVAPDERLMVTASLVGLSNADELPSLSMPHLAAVFDELIGAIKRLEAGYQWESDRRLVRSWVTTLEKPGWDVGQVTLSAALPGLKRLPTQASDATLADGGRSVVGALLRVISRGHLELAISGTSAKMAASDDQGEAVLWFATQLVELTPAAELMPGSRCVWCGEPVAGERSTKRYCSVAHKRAWLRSHQRSPEDPT